MPPIRRFLTALTVLLLAADRSFAADQLPLIHAEQALVVITRDWDAVPGVLTRYERSEPSAPWRQVGQAIPVVVGRNGMGWGRGLNPESAQPGPHKREGDGKSPAGVFRLGSAFGLDNSLPGIKLPYWHLTSAIECVDDENSRHYNTILDRGEAGAVDWKSSEKMRDVGECYRLGVVVEHNTNPRNPGGGSCVFLHIWKTVTTPTSGCTAMASNNMETLITWLDPAKHPVLVQLPEAGYKRFRKEWKLPGE